MKTPFAAISLGLLLATTPCVALAQDTVPVDAHNFPRAETDMYFARFVKEGALGKLTHTREPTPIDKQSVVRMNRDTLYSEGVFDLDAGPVTITLPDPGKRYMALQVISEDQYTVEVVYGPGTFTYDKAKVGTRYLAFFIRTLADPQNPDDVKAANQLQDAVKVEQASVGTFEIPKWDEVSQKKARDALAVLGSLGGLVHSFGTKDEVDPVDYLIGASIGWGGNPPYAAKYETVTPAKNDGTTVYSIVMKDVPVDGFWSISVYNEEGFFEKNDLNAYSVNNLTAKPGEDGAVTIQFGGCDGKIANCLPITKGWNYAVRLYRPRAEILDGSWKLPEAQPLS